MWDGPDSVTYNNNNNNSNNNIDICIAPYGRNFRGAGPGSVLVGMRRGKIRLQASVCASSVVSRCRICWMACAW